MALDLTADEQFIQLLTEQYGWQIERPWFTSVPQPAEKYVGRCIEEVRSIRDVLLETNVIKDTFGTDHTARRALLKKLEQEHPLVARWLSKHSKLRGRKVIETLWNMDQLLISKKQSDVPLFIILTEIFTSSVSNPSSRYNEMEVEEKVEYARTIEDAAYRFLAAMTDNTSLRQVLRIWRALPLGAQYYCKVQELPPSGKEHRIFLIDKFKSGIRPDSPQADFDYYAFGELFKDAYLSELIQRCCLERGTAKGPIYNQGEGIFYQQTMGPDVSVAVQYDNDKDDMNINLFLNPDFPIKMKVIETTHDFLQRLAIQQVDVPKLFGY